MGYKRRREGEGKRKNVKKNNTHIYNNIKSFNYTLWEKTFGLNSSP